MEEGTKQRLQATALMIEKKSIHAYKNACATRSNTFVSVGQVGINSSPLVNQPVVLLSAN
jgi:hypothetical protein